MVHECTSPAILVVSWASWMSTSGRVHVVFCSDGLGQPLNLISRLTFPIDLGYTQHVSFQNFNVLLHLPITVHSQLTLRKHLAWPVEKLNAGQFY